MHKEDKKNCYSCKHKGSVPGSAHSSCKHPVFDNFEIKMKAAIVCNAYGTNGFAKGNSHGVRSGWFNHPLDFDPVWLEECVGYEQNIA